MLRKMIDSDLDQIMELEHELFTSCWKESDFLYELNENPYSTLIVIEKNNEIIGYAGIWCLFEQGQITTIGIKKKYQGQGFSKILMDELIKTAEANKCENISLEVRVSNTKAIKLYEKYGFIKINLRKNYYADNHEDAYLMMKGIGGIVDVNNISN